MNEVSQYRANIQKFEAALKELPQLQEELHHYFAYGTYAREMRVPAGTLLVGKIHRYSGINIILAGSAEVRSEDGAFRVQAPYIYVSPPGTKRAVYALEDLIWVNIHPANTDDVDQIERELICDTYDQFDHSQFLLEYGLNEEIARQVTENTDDMVDVFPGHLEISPSCIHGFGVFAKGDIPKGDVIGRARIVDKRTPLGRCVNHSATPNAEPVLRDDMSIDFVATRDISREEVTVNYRDVLRINVWAG